MEPKSHGILPKHFNNVIQCVFSNYRNQEICLGGGCALVEYFLGHRNTSDIDFFVFHSSTINHFKDLEWYVGDRKMKKLVKVLNKIGNKVKKNDKYEVK